MDYEKKPTEFQIGDWVIPYIFDTALKPSKIVGISYNSYRGEDYVDWVDCEVWDELSLNDIKPIPLTEKILERNGFKKYEGDYHNEYVCEKWDETSYYEIVICWKDSYDNGALDAFNHVQWDEGWKLDIIGEGSYNKGWCKTIYLHELQHALRLCGLNELADNFKL